MVRMGEFMLKSFSIFSFSFLYLGFLFAQDTTVVEVQESIQDSTSVLLIEQEKVNYPGKPLIMSLVLPGAGQYYNKSPMWKTASFLGVELGSIIAWNYFFKESQRLKEDYKAFADLHWTLNDWVTNRFEPPTQMHESMSWTNFTALTKLTGTHDLSLIISGDLANELNLTQVSSDSLDVHPEWLYSGDVVVVRDGHFYENIGKYDQFLGGWSDAKDAWYWEEKDVGDSTEIIIKTPLKENYINQRYESNQMLSAVKYSITVLMFNHVISGIESVWTNQRKASDEQKQEKTSSIDTKLSLVYNPSNPGGIGGLRFALYF